MKQLKLLNNLLAPPPQPEPGQIWYMPEIERDVLITNADYLKETGVIRALVLSRVASAGDGHDVNILPADAPDAGFGSPRCALRATEGPLPVSVLSLFCGTVQKKKFSAVIKTLPIPRQYSVEQLNYVTMLLEQLEPYRWQAVELAK